MNNRPVNKFLMLPDDLVLNCLARVSRFHCPTLSLVSKRFRSLLASKEFYQIRILLGLTESFLYLCLRLRTDSNLQSWFVLYQGPNNSEKVLRPISIPYASMPSVAVVGPNIYAIGSGLENNASSSIMVMDSRFNTWHEAPSMRVARVFPSACVLDDKIYVMGGCDNLDSMNWMEVFDTKTQTWEFLQIPSEEICVGSKYQSVKYEGTVYVMSQEKYMTYKLHKGRWREADICLNRGWTSSPSYCVIGNVFYRYNSRRIHWYDLKNRLWKNLKGLEGSNSRFPFSSDHVKLTDHGGKIAIVWEEYVRVDHNKQIWCAEIVLEKRQDEEIWGKLEWIENLLISNGPNGDKGLVHAVAATVW